MKITGLLLDAENPHPFFNKVEVEIDEGKLEPLYSILNCGIIDIVVRRIGGEYFDIVCDDEGLFKENPVISAVDESGRLALVGNLFICHHTEDGHLSSLKEEDYIRIRNNACMLFVEDKAFQAIRISY